MSNHGDAPESSVTKTTSDAVAPADKEAVEASKDPQSTATKPELDEFGLPIRKKKRISFQEPEDGDEPKSSKEEEPIQEEDEGTEKDVEGGAVKGSLPPSTHGERVAIPIEGADKELGVQNTKEHATEQAESAKSAEARQEAETSKEQQSAVNGAQQRRPSGPPPYSPTSPSGAVSEFSHQRVVPQPSNENDAAQEEDEWQTMPAYAPFDIYDDNGKLIAREAEESDDEAAAYAGLGGAGKGYTRVTVDDDAQSATSMDDNTAYLFKEQTTGLIDEDEDSRDVLAQMQATKDLLTDGQRIAYVGITRLAMVKMQEEMEKRQRTKSSKKSMDQATESLKMWAQKMVLRLYMHMDIEAAEQLMIEQLAEHGVTTVDLSPTLMKNARVKNPMAEDAQRFSISSSRPSTSDANRPSTSDSKEKTEATLPHTLPTTPDPTKTDAPPIYPEKSESPPPYDSAAQQRPDSQVISPTDLPKTADLDIDIRWTVLCDLFLVLIADSVYDSRSRQLLENVGQSLEVPWIDICRFEKRVTDALEMQEAADKENWNEEEHMESRRKRQRNRRLAMMGLATVGGSIVIGLSAGLLAPLIGAGLAAGFTTIGVAGTSGFLTGAGGIAAVAATGVVSGGAIGQKAAMRRTGAVKTFEYRPLHNNKRTNLIVTISGWMTGKVDDVRLPFSTVDPIMGDIYSIHWEPEMLRSMGDTIGILASEALTQTLQQILGSTILISLMAALQLPVVLTKLSYLIDNPWSNSVARAHLAGLILADSLIDRNLGTRPVTLVGFSLGAKVIMSCLTELVAKGAYGLVQNVYLFGSPVIANKDVYLKARSAVAGRFVNGYASNDWILGYLFRATGGGIMRVAGLAPVEVEGVENVNVSELVAGHMQYRAAMPRILRHVGWAVESDEFVEIEDPDPENHQGRQRELINEIEEARKDLEKKSDRKFFGLFKRNKQRTEKKDWETYDERAKEMPHQSNPEGGDAEGGVLFDVDAVRSQVARLAAQQELEAEGIEVRELQSTMPPMKLDTSATSSRVPSPALKSSRSYNEATKPTLQVHGSEPELSRHSANPSARQSFDNWDDYDKQQVRPNNNNDISMTFDTSYREPPSRSSLDPASRNSFDPSGRSSFDPSSRPSFEPLPPPPPQKEEWRKSPSPGPSWVDQPHPPPPAEDRWRKSPSPRPLGTNLSAAAAAAPLDYHHNAWQDDDDDEFGKEKEVRMTFA